METLALDTVVLDDNAGAADDLARVALTVDLAKTGPGTEHLGVTDLYNSCQSEPYMILESTHLDQVDLVLGTESFNQLDVLGLSAGLDQNGKMCLAFVECFCALTETAGETVVDKSVLQDLL